MSVYVVKSNLVKIIYSNILNVAVSTNKNFLQMLKFTHFYRPCPKFEINQYIVQLRVQRAHICSNKFYGIHIYASACKIDMYII